MVEKILNQMINVVNALIDKYGSIDEIRIEMARELKLSKDGRESAAKSIRAREKANDEISNRIKELGLSPSKNKILKYRLWEESDKRCFYCGQPVNATEFLNGLDVEIEHIIPNHCCLMILSLTRCVLAVNVMRKRVMPLHLIS